MARKTLVQQWAILGADANRGTGRYPKEEQASASQGEPSTQHPSVRYWNIRIKTVKEWLLCINI
jgi:hypothetical protein